MKKFTLVLGVLVVLSMVLASCSTPAAPAEAPAEEAPAEAPAEEAPAAEEPAELCAWGLSPILAVLMIKASIPLSGKVLNVRWKS